MSKTSEISAHRTLLNLNRSLLEIYMDYEKRLNGNNPILISEDIEKMRVALQNIDNVTIAWNTSFA